MKSNEMYDARSANEIETEIIMHEIQLNAIQQLITIENLFI